MQDVRAALWVEAGVEDGFEHLFIFPPFTVAAVVAIFLFLVEFG